MVALLRTGRRPWVEYAELIEERGTAAAVLEEELAGARRRPGRRVCSTRRPPARAGGAAPDRDELLAQARADLERWNAGGMRLVTVLDPDYPPNLRAVHDRPPMVFMAGRLTPADARGVAVVGARKATDAGLQTATNFARHLANSGYTVISGLAAGIDTAAHTGALARKVAPSPSSGPASPAPIHLRTSPFSAGSRTSVRSSRSSGPIRRPAAAASRCATRSCPASP